MLDRFARSSRRSRSEMLNWNYLERKPLKGLSRNSKYSNCSGHGRTRFLASRNGPRSQIEAKSFRRAGDSNTIEFMAFLANLDREST